MKIVCDLKTGIVSKVQLTTEEEADLLNRQTAHAAEQAELARTKYQRDRAAEYPSIGDQLDALWKGGDAATAMLAQVQAVKNKYPKG